VEVSMRAIIVGSFLVLAVFTISAFAANKTLSTKVIKADTTISIKVDTIRKITYDTSLITKTYKDTVILIKTDTTKSVPKIKK
jgi:hypothetical protein